MGADRGGQLVRKWTCVVRLSRRVKDLETELERVKKELESCDGGGKAKAASSLAGVYAVRVTLSLSQPLLLSPACYSA